MEVCAGFELIAVENTTTRGDDLLEIGKGREAQMIRHMRHGSPPRLMTPQLIRGHKPREPYATPSAGSRITCRGVAPIDQSAIYLSGVQLCRWFASAQDGLLRPGYDLNKPPSHRS